MKTRNIVLTEGESRCFIPAARPDGNALFVRNVDGRLHIAVTRGALRSLIGNGMAEKVVDTGDESREAVRPDMIDDSWFYVMTDERRDDANVLIKLVDGAFDLIGGSSIIAEIKKL